MSEVTRDELLDLATRCEVASGPDRKLDTDISCALGNRMSLDARDILRGRHGSLYSASLDAAMGLVPDGCLASVKQLWDGPNRHGYALVNLYETDAGDCDGWRHTGVEQGIAATPALALCAAALRARAASMACPTPEKG